jgi:hypothetical protein
MTHFLTDKPDRQKYVRTLKRALTSDGYVIIATLGIDGSLKCSGNKSSAISALPEVPPQPHEA